MNEVDYLRVIKIVQYIEIQDNPYSVSIRSAIEAIGIERIVETIGIERIVETIGIERIVETIGIERIIEAIGIEALFQIPKEIMFELIEKAESEEKITKELANKLRDVFSIELKQ